MHNFDKGLMYPPFSNIRKISANIAASVAAKAYEQGLATRRPQPDGRPGEVRRELHVQPYLLELPMNSRSNLFLC